MRHRALWALLTILILGTAACGQNRSDPSWREQWEQRQKAAQQAGARPVQAESPTPRRSSPPAKGEPVVADSKAAAATVEKLSRKGEINGQNWSITANLDGKPLAEALQWLSDTAGQKPWEVKVIVDYPGLAERENLGLVMITVNLPGVSLQDVLDVVLPEGVNYAVQEDGTVLISATGALEAIAGTWPLGPDLPTKAAADVRRTLARRGTVDGVRRSVDIEFVDLPRSEMLQKIADLAAQKPFQVKMLVNMPLIRERLGSDIDLPITVRGADISLHQALSLVLGGSLGYVIQNDGTVLVAPRDSLAYYQQVSLQVVFPGRNWIRELSDRSGGPGEMLWIESAELADVQAAAARACSDVLGIPEDSPLVKQLCQFIPAALTAGGRRVDLGIIIGGGSDPRSTKFVEVRPVADQVAERMIADIKNQVAASAERMLTAAQQRRKDLEAQAAGLEAQTEKLTQRLDLLQAEVNEPRFTLFRTTKDYALECERDRQVRAMDLEAQKARQRALAERIALIRSEVQAGLEKDAIGIELEHVVKIRQEQLAGAGQLVQAGRAQRETVLEAEIRLAEARTALAERREAVSRAVGGDLLARLNADLVAVSVDMAESEARLASLTKLVAEHYVYLGLVRKQSDLSMEQSRLRQETGPLKSRLSRFEQALTGAQLPRVDAQSQAH